MIYHVPRPEIQKNWKTISAALKQFWDVTINLETIENLYQRLMDNDCLLWYQTTPDKYRILFVTETHDTATANVMTITHCAGFNLSGKRYGRAEIKQYTGNAFRDIEAVAKRLGYDAISIHARPATVAMTKDEGYETWSVHLIKQFDKET